MLTTVTLKLTIRKCVADDDDSHHRFCRRLSLENQTRTYWNYDDDDGDDDDFFRNRNGFTDNFRVDDNACWSPAFTWFLPVIFFICIYHIVCSMWCALHQPHNTTEIIVITFCIFTFHFAFSSTRHAMSFPSTRNNPIWNFIYYYFVFFLVFRFALVHLLFYVSLCMYHAHSV